MDGDRLAPAWQRTGAVMALCGTMFGPLPGVASPVFVSGSIAAKATAQAGGLPEVVDEKSQVFTSPPPHARLDASAYSQTGPGPLDTQVSARMQIEADWNGVDRGSVMLDQGFGGVSTFSTGSAFASGLRLWSYTFRVDQDAHLLFQYDVSIDTALGGTADGGFVFSVSGVPVGTLTTGLNGTLDLPLEAGETYTISLRNIIGGFRVSGPSRFSAGYHGFFQWSIEDLPTPAVAVPEPATLPLIGLTLLAAVGLRRWRPAASPARAGAADRAPRRWPRPTRSGHAPCARWRGSAPWHRH